MDASPLYTELCGMAQEKLDFPVMLIGEDLNIIYTNEQSDETFGPLCGMHASFLFQECHRQSCMEQIEKTLKEGIHTRTDISLADVEYKLSGVGIKSADGQSYLYLTLEDISEAKYLRKTLETNLKRLKRETEIAKQIQHSILPINDEYWKTIKLTARYAPASELGGDVYDIVRLENGKFIIYISDVSGHGIQASLLTMFVRENVRSGADLASESLLPLVERITQRYINLAIDSAMYISMLLCLYDPAAGEISVVNAGHNCYPIISRNGGKRVEEIPVRGLPISRLSEDAEYEEEIFSVEKGDRLILYTDGLVEEYSRAEGGTFSPEGMRRVVASSPGLAPEALIEKLFGESEKYMGLGAKDDRTLVIADIM